MIHLPTNFIVVDDAGTARPMGDTGRISTSLAMFASGLRQDSKSGRWNTHKHSLREMNRHMDMVERSDAFDATAGLFQPRDLAHKMRTVLEERLPPLNGREVFPVNTEVPPGSKSFEQSRFYGTGQAVVYRGGPGQDIPDVGLSQASFDSPVLYMVSAASLDILEEMSANRTGLDVNARKMQRARLAIMELQNKWTWEGASAFGLTGLLNHPYIDRGVSQVNYATGSASDILADLYYWADYAHTVSGQAFRADTLIISNALHNLLTGTLVPDTDGSNVIEMLLRHKPHIRRVVAVRELDDKGGDGVHVLTFTRQGAGSADRSAEIISVMEPFMLPAERGALASKMYMLAGFGGLNALEVGNMINVYVSGE